MGCLIAFTVSNPNPSHLMSLIKMGVQDCWLYVTEFWLVSEISLVSNIAEEVRDEPPRLRPGVHRR